MAACSELRNELNGRRLKAKDFRSLRFVLLHVVLDGDYAYLAVGPMANFGNAAVKVRRTVIDHHNRSLARRDQVRNHARRLRRRIVIHVCINYQRGIKRILADARIE
jgi:hypothetical protein